MALKDLQGDLRQRPGPSQRRLPKCWEGDPAAGEVEWEPWRHWLAGGLAACQRRPGALRRVGQRNIPERDTGWPGEDGALER